MGQQIKLHGERKIMTDEEDKKSRIYIEFEEPNSTLFDAKVENVTAMQLLTLAGYFEFKAKFMLTQQEYELARQAEMQRISVPKPNIEVAHK